jgi:uncharacterized protein (TIGR02646 family)
MIRVSRRSPPRVILEHGRQWTKLLLQAKTAKERKRILLKYGHASIRTALNYIFNGKCAYCESKIAQVSYAHIEHYRPKSKYPQLAFDWDNLLLSCSVCNSSHYKGDKFPGANEGGPLLNPCQDDPEEHLVFVFDRHLFVASIYGASARGRVSEQVLGLNRPDLRTYRSTQGEETSLHREQGTRGSESTPTTG